MLAKVFSAYSAKLYISYVPFILRKVFIQISFSFLRNFPDVKFIEYMFGFLQNGFLQRKAGLEKLGFLAPENLLALQTKFKRTLCT